MKWYYFQLLFLLALTWAGLPAAELTPFYIPAETGPGSLLALSATPLTPPQRLTVSDGHFVDQTGKRIRLWGVNLAFAANFPEHADAEKIARRLSAAGVNTVRCHHMDTSPWPRGICNPDYQSLNTEALDRLDYFIDQLARNGIYVNLNLHVGATYSKILGLPDSQRSYDKVVNIFTEPLINAQKNYAGMLLGHLNPYRQMTYSADPAIAFVEITNENSFFMWDGEEALRDLQPHYASLLQQKFNLWLKNRYNSDQKLAAAWGRDSSPLQPDLLLNGNLSGAAANGQPGNWILEQHDPAHAILTVDKGRLKLTPGKTSDSDWHLQFQQRGFALKKGQIYTLTFNAWADSKRSIVVSIGQTQDPWKNLGLYRPVTLTLQPTPYKMVFVAGEDEKSARLCFVFAKESPAFNLSEIHLQPGAVFELDKGESLQNGSIALYAQTESAARMTDRLAFLAETEKNYFDQMYRYIKQELHSQSLVTGTIVFGPLGMYAQSGMDFIDSHAYWQHPNFPNRPWDQNDWLIRQKAMSAEPQLGTLLRLATERLAGKPYTVTEYNHPAPLDTQAECVPMIASCAALQDWDGVWLYTYSHSNDQWNRQQMNSFFDIDTNPAKWGFVPAGSLLFRQQQLPALSGSKIGVIPTAGNDLSALVSQFLVYKDNLAGAGKIQLDDFKQNRLAVCLSATPPATLAANPQSSSRLTSSGNGDTGYYLAESSGALVLCGTSALFSEATGKRITIASPVQSSLTITTLDNLPLEQSRKLFITACGRCENRNMVFSADRSTIGTKWGEPPAGIESITGTITLPPAAWKCQPLKPDGTPAASFNFNGNLNLSAEHSTMWYLITRS